MTATTCHYHPAVPALWFCARCQFNLCSGCAPKTRSARFAYCPACRMPVDALGTGHLVKPFWERLPRFFAYPARGQLLLFMALLSTPALLVTSMPLLTLPLFVAVFIISLRYCHRVLYHTALGNLTPPPVFTNTDEFRHILFQQIGAFLVLFSAPGVVAGMFQSEVLLWVLITLAFLLLPASVMVLAIEERFLAAINPLTLIGVALRIGPSYLLLWLFLMLFSAAADQILIIVAPGVDIKVTLFIYLFASLYFSLAMFHLMGYVVFQYHEPLGFSIDHNVVEQASDPGPAAVLDPIQIMITEGRLDEAERELADRLRQNLDDLNLHDRYNRLLIGLADKPRGLPHADLYIGKLLASGQAGRALEVYRRSCEALGAVEIKEATETLALARLARERNDPRQTLSLLARFEQRFPGHALLPEALLLAAQALCEHAGRDDLAGKIVERLLRTHPQHPLRPQMDSLLKVIQSLRRQREAASAQTPVK